MSNSTYVLLKDSIERFNMPVRDIPEAWVDRRGRT